MLAGGGVGAGAAGGAPFASAGAAPGAALGGMLGAIAGPIRTYNDYEDLKAKRDEDRNNAARQLEADQAACRCIVDIIINLERI